MKLLEINNLSISIRKEKNIYKKVVNQDLIINKGDVVLLSGPNGSGKSSIVKSIIGDVLGFNSLEAIGDYYFYQNEQKIKINKNEQTLSFFAGLTCYVSQNDDIPFATVIDCFLSSVEKEKIENKEKYIFDFILKHKAYECYYSSEEEVKLTSKAIKFLKSNSLDVYNIENQKIALFLTSKKKNLSGGQAKFLNILSNLVRIEFCQICLIDEPLNNLDYSNVRLFSNIIADIHEEYPEKAFIIVSHCRSIPAINRYIEIDIKDKKLMEVHLSNNSYNFNCNSCFGKVRNGRYV